MKHIFIVLFFITVSLGFAQNNSSIRGTVKEEESLKRLENITVSVDVNGKKQQTLTDSRGEFTLNNIPNGDVELIFASKNHTEKKLNVSINGTTDVGSVYLHLKSGSSIAMDDVISLSDEELDDESSNEAISGILSASNDVFGQATAYTFSWARFRRRGYGSEYTNLYFDGLPFNNMENGRAYWYLWGGLNDATRNKVYTEGLKNSDYGFGGIGGTTNIISRADEQRKGTKITYSNANRSYTNRVMVTHSTGLMDNGWAFTASMSKRWAKEGYVEGTYYDAYGYLFSAFKRINDNHALNLTVFGAPSDRGGMNTSVQEMKDIADDNFYNPAWGYQNGEKRNSKVQKTHIPIAILQHYWQIDDKTKITTTFSGIKGESGRTAIDWYNDADPRPDYYRYLPSYQSNPEMAKLVHDRLANDKAARQINWDEMIRSNKNTYDDGRAVYVLSNRKNDVTQYMANILATHELNENINLRGGAYYNSYTGHHYNELEDLLGATYFLDVDQFNERDFGTGDVAQSDLNNPDRKVYEGDTYNNNYKAHVRKSHGFLQGEFSYNMIDFYASASYTNTTMWREGLYEKGLIKVYRDKGLINSTSYGDSKKLKFNDYAIKTGATLKLSGRHYFVANAAYMKVAPTFWSTFLSPRTRNDFVNGIESEKILSGDIGYKMKYDFLKMDITAYYTKIKDKTETRSYYTNYSTSAGGKGFLNSVMTGIDHQNMGVEFAFDAQLHSSLNLVGAVAIGQHKYTSRPNYLLIQESKPQPVFEDVVYVKNFKQTGFPQQAYTLGLKYRHPSYTWVGINANYYRDSYLSFSPLRRTETVIKSLERGSDNYYKTINQEEFDGTFTLDANIGKSWRIDYKYYINLNISVTNILDTKDFRSGGYEQSRINTVGSALDVDKFPPKYYYAFGRSYFINLSFRF